LIGAGKLFVLLPLLAVSALWAQSPADSSHEYSLRAESTLVVIPVTVSDPSNRFVLGLEKNDFTLLEDGVPQKITQFAGEDAPLSVGLLVDTSGSMGEKLETSRKAVAEFLHTMNSGDEAFLVEFSDKAKLVAGFSPKTAEIEDKLVNIESQGLTAMLDAVYLGLDEMKKAKNPRKALLIISDGGDNNSTYTSSQITDLVRKADVQIYSMGVFEVLPALLRSPAEVNGPKLLSQLSQQTGGRAFSATSSSDLPTVAKRIGIELRNQYVLAYAPSNHAHDGKYRKVEVKLNPPPGLVDLKTRWRLGYYAPTVPAE
jgi:Ca-activated chloride channel family protein